MSIMKIDLHCHSTASDGALSPTALAERAHAQGVQLLALTDHDTLAGLAEARAACQSLGMHLVNGVELSCLWGGATIHVLGYDFAQDTPELTLLLNNLHEARWLRAHEIDRRLAKKGFADTFIGAQQVQAELGDTSSPPARPHFAEHMVRAGYVKDHGDAFKKWLGSGKIGDVKQHWPTLEEVMLALAQANAKISLAHPYHYDFTRSKRRRLIQAFAALGGHALEVSNGMQAVEQVGTLAVLAREFNLAITAGSDFHAPRTWSELGMYRAPAQDLPPLWLRFDLPEPVVAAVTGV